MFTIEPGSSCRPWSGKLCKNEGGKNCLIMDDLQKRERREGKDKTKTKAHTSRRGYRFDLYRVAGCSGSAGRCDLSAIWGVKTVLKNGEIKKSD